MHLWTVSQVCRTGLAPASCLAFGFSPSTCILPVNSLWLGTLSLFLAHALFPGVLCSPAHLPQSAAVPMKVITLRTPSHMHLSGCAQPAVTPWDPPRPRPVLLNTGNEDRMTSKGQVIVVHCSDFSALLKLFILVHSGIAWVVLVWILESFMARKKNVPTCSQTWSIAAFLHFTPNSAVLHFTPNSTVPKESELVTLFLCKGILLLSGGKKKTLTVALWLFGIFLIVSFGVKLRTSALPLRSNP